MSEKHLLVDFENIQKLDPGEIPSDYCITVFIGHAQKAVPIELAKRAQPLGSRLNWESVDGNGKNALDFHIAYRMGVLLTKNPKAECVVLSKDSGFDPLLRQLKKKGHCCRRVNSQSELVPAPKGPEKPADPNFKRLKEVLAKSDKRSRPQTRKTLAKHIGAILPKDSSPEELSRLIDLLFSERLVTESAQRLTYLF